MSRKSFYPVLLLFLAFTLTACQKGNNHIAQNILRKDQTATTLDAPASAFESLIGRNSKISASEPKEPEPLTEAAEFEYGANPGNIYNGGQFLSYLDGQYFLCTHLNETYIADGNWGYFQEGVRMSQMNYMSGRVYGIHSEPDNAAYDGCLMIYDVTRKTGTLYPGRKPEYLYVVNNEVIYNDAGSHMLLRFDPMTNEEHIICDDSVSCPTVFENMVIFSNEADGGSLYRIPVTGGTPKKLNNRESTWPLVYNGNVYYTGTEGNSSALYRVGLDGSNDGLIKNVRVEKPLIIGNTLYFVSSLKSEVISCLDLEDPYFTVSELDFGDEILELLSHEVSNLGTYRVKRIQEIASVDTRLVFRTYLEDERGYGFYDGSQYNLETGVVSLSPIFEDQVSAPYADLVAVEGSLLTLAEENTEIASLESSPARGHNYYSGLTPAEALAADEKALKIAEDILSDPNYETEQEMIQAAATAVKKYVDKAKYGADENLYYRSPYGVFVSKNYSSQGAARALGRVLDYMGISWVHANEYTDSYQWCILQMDGQPGYADAVMGSADLGNWEDHFTVVDGAVYKKAVEGENAGSTDNKHILGLRHREDYKEGENGEDEESEP